MQVLHSALPSNNLKALYMYSWQTCSTHHIFPEEHTPQHSIQDHEDVIVQYLFLSIALFLLSELPDHNRGTNLAQGLDLIDPLDLVVESQTL